MGTAKLLNNTKGCLKVIVHSRLHSNGHSVEGVYVDVDVLRCGTPNSSDSAGVSLVQPSGGAT